MKNKIVILLFTLFFISSSLIYLYLYEIKTNNNSKIENSKNSLYFYMIPKGTELLNRTLLTSLVATTEQESQNETIIHLMNGLNLNTTDSSIKSGNTILLNVNILKAICTVSIIGNNNTQPQNNTFYMLKIIKDPRCSDSSKILELVSWNKVNQK